MDHTQQKWIIWGAGKKGQKLYDDLSERGWAHNIVAVVDMDEKKWGSAWNGHEIENPEAIKGREFDKLIIAMVQWRGVYQYIVDHYGVKQEKIDNYFFLQRGHLLDFYEGKENSPEEEKYIAYVRKFPLDVFNDFFPSKYEGIRIPVYFDEKVQMYYVYYGKKRMYFPRGFDKKGVEAYCRQILMEQDIKSPHKYQDHGFMVEPGETVLDIGAAEGNFSLDVIDTAKKVYLVETDKGWVEALEQTFEPYREKVCIIQKYVCDCCNEECITIDELAKQENFTSIKMDIEGAEAAAIKGGGEFLRRSFVKAFICCYHEENHYREISEMLQSWGYSIAATDGYMVFLGDGYPKQGQAPKFVKGVIRAQKTGPDTGGTEMERV